MTLSNLNLEKSGTISIFQIIKMILKDSICQKIQGPNPNKKELVNIVIVITNIASDKPKYKEITKNNAVIG